MQFLRLKGVQADKKRKNGTKIIIPLFREKNRKYGKVKKDQAISRKRPILITGAHHSGKTRTLDRLYEHSLDIWGGQPKIKQALRLDQIQPISQWYEAEQVRKWWESLETDTTGQTQTDSRPWQKLKAWEKVELLPKFCQQKNTVVFLDDVHKLTGRKMDIAKKCIQSARITVVTTSEEGRLPPSIRAVILPQNPQILRLDSDVAYDGTSALLWILIVIAVVAGAFEVALVLGGLKWLGYGRRASRQD